jgi:hypothetical protein
MFRFNPSRRRAAVGCAVGVAALSAAAVAHATLSQVPVFTGPPSQITPAAAGTTLMWSHNSSTNRGPYSVYLKIGGATAVKLNGTGTQGYGGGISGDTAVFQRVYNGQSDIRLYNTTTHTYPALPSGWNTKGWEWRPTISGTMVLFGRATGSNANFTEKIYLGDLSTGQLTLLASRTGLHAHAHPGQVNGNYAVWYQCQDSRVACNVYRYDISAGTTTLVPNTFGSGKQQYAPSVATDGTVYFVHSGASCGASVTLVRQPLAGSKAVLVSFNKGIDVDTTYTDDTGGTPSVYYAKGSCSNWAPDIYKVVD